jgi:hypothetical protein
MLSTELLLKKILLNNPDLKVPTSTWTYLINDNPFENMFGLQFIGNRGIGISLGVLMVWPLMILFPLLKKISRKTKRHRGELLE